MAKPNLTADRARALLNYDETTGLLTRRISLSHSARVGDVAGYAHPTKRYIYVFVDGRRYFAHRVVWLMCVGQWPVGQVDHINGDRIDNRLGNLREVDNRMNGQNKHVPKQGNTSGLLGVSWMTQAGKWRAQIKTEAGMLYLGLFTDKFVAHEAYLTAKRLHHAGAT